MRYFVLGDDDTVLGFRYAGVDGKAVHTAEQARDTLADQMQLGQAGVILVTDRVASMISDQFSELRFKSRLPLVVQIPGAAGPAPDRQDLLRLIREAMGIKF